MIDEIIGKNRGPRAVDEIDGPRPTIFPQPFKASLSKHEIGLELGRGWPPRIRGLCHNGRLLLRRSSGLPAGGRVRCEKP